MKGLIACECSGTVRDAFAAHGHDVWSCDLSPSDNGGKHIQDDVRNHLNSSWDFLIAHPPCTFLCVSGARWFDDPKYPTRRADQARAKDFFMLFVNAPIIFIAIENPIGIMSTQYRKPEQIIQPYQFGHGDTKATCLWLKNLPLLVPTSENIYTNPDVDLHHLPPSEERGKLRSITFDGIAKAMAKQWTKAMREFYARNL